jgi:hypothetical protein
MTSIPTIASNSELVDGRNSQAASPASIPTNAPLGRLRPDSRGISAPRQYAAVIAAIPGASTSFQRASSAESHFGS